ILMLRWLRLRARPDRTIPAWAGEDRTPNASRRANERLGAGAAARLVATRSSPSPAAAEPPSWPQAAFSIRAKRNQKAFSEVFAIDGRSALRGFLPRRVLYSRRVRAGRRKRRAIRAARSLVDWRAE